MVQVESEQDIERLRSYAKCVEHECELLRRRIVDLTGRLAEAQGVEQQELLLAELNELNASLSKTTKSDALGGNSERRRPENSARRPKEPQRGHGPTEQPDLKVIQEVLLLDEADQICPKCGEELQVMQGQFDESDLIDVVDVTYTLKKIKQQKYRCQCCQHIDTALPSEDRLIEGGRYSVDFAVHVIEQKYMMHLPLTRQARQMKLANLDVTSQTLWDQQWHATCLLLPSWKALHKLVLQQDVVGADETRWRLMKKNSLTKPQIISLTSEAGIFYGFEKDKTAETVGRLLGDFSGWLVVDGISIYPAIHQRRLDGVANGTREGPVFQLANCWVHARRNFIKAEPDFPIAGRMLDLIAKLYRVVSAAHRDNINAEVRREWVNALLDGMKSWMLEARPPPGSSIAQAIGYLDDHWKGLTKFRDHPEVWLDNNATERSLRAPILGRRNHYGSRSERGMQSAAVFYSLIETCRLLGVNPREYLRQALRQAKENPGSVYLPHQMLDDQPDGDAS